MSLQVYRLDTDSFWKSRSRSALNSIPFTLGTTQPDATNTGYGALGYTSASLVDMPQGDLIITTDGTLVEGKRIHGIVRINASNVTIRGCEIVSYAGHPYIDSSNYGMISSTGTGNVFEYNHITQYDPSTSTDNSTWWMVGVLMNSGTATVYRNNIHDTNDLVYIKGGTQQVQGNYLHEPGFRTDDQDQSGSSPAYWSHNDGVQIMGGTNHLVDGNSIEMKFSTLTGMNSTANPDPNAEQVWPNCHGMIIQNNKNAISGVTVQRNWFKYGSNAIRFGGAQAFDPGGAVTVIQNRFTPDQGKEFSQYVQIRNDPTTSWSPQPTIDSTNVYSNDADTPLAAQGQPLTAPSTSGTTTIWAYNSGAHTP
jgi:hypothetical protein